MSPTLASTLALAMYAIALLPLASIAAGKGARTVLTAYAAIVIAAAFYQTGIFATSLTRTDMTAPAFAPSNDEQCRKIRELMQESGLSVDRTDPAEPKIVGQGAAQIPVEIRDVLIQCLDTQAPADIDAVPANGDLQAEPPLIGGAATIGSYREVQVG